MPFRQIAILIKTRKGKRFMFRFDLRVGNLQGFDFIFAAIIRSAGLFIITTAGCVLKQLQIRQIPATIMRTQYQSGRK